MNQKPLATLVTATGAVRRARIAVSPFCIAVLAACAARVEPSTAPSEPVPAAAQAAQPAAGQGDVANGQRLFEVNCVFCHGPDGTGGPGGGAPLVNVTDPEVVVRTVNDGRGYTMPSFFGVLSTAEIRDVSIYVTQRLAQ